MYCAVAGAYQSLDQNDNRDRVFAAALEFAKSAADPKQRATAFVNVAAKQADLGNVEGAAANFDLALKSANEINDSYVRTCVLGEIADRLSRAGFHIEAKKVLSQAKEVAEKIPQQDMQLQALEKVRTLIGKLPKG